MKSYAVPLLTALFAIGAFSAQAETVSEALQKCRNTDNSLKRLVCYDNVAKVMNQYEGADAQLSQMAGLAPRYNNAQPTQRTMPAVGITNAQNPQNEFGLEHKRDVSEAASEVALTIKNISENVRGKKVLTFADGTVWQQTDETYLKIEEGQVVSIERGLLGAFFLSVEGLNKRMKVKRIK